MGRWGDGEMGRFLLKVIIRTSLLYDVRIISDKKPYPLNLIPFLLPSAFCPLPSLQFYYGYSTEHDITPE